MILEVISVAFVILVAVLGSTWRLSGQIKGITSKVDALTERLDRVNVEQLRDRVTRLEVKLTSLHEACKDKHG